MDIAKVAHEIIKAITEHTLGSLKTGGRGVSGIPEIDRQVGFDQMKRAEESLTEILITFREAILNEAKSNV